MKLLFQRLFSGVKPRSIDWHVKVMRNSYSLIGSCVSTQQSFAFARRVWDQSPRDDRSAHETAPPLVERLWLRAGCALKPARYREQASEVGRAGLPSHRGTTCRRRVPPTVRKTKLSRDALIDQSWSQGDRGNRRSR